MGLGRASLGVAPRLESRDFWLKQIRRRLDINTFYLSDQMPNARPAGDKAAPASLGTRLHGKKLLDIMDDFRIRLAEQVNKFTTQALEVDERDRQLIAQRDKALQLGDTQRHGCAWLEGDEMGEP